MSTPVMTTTSAIRLGVGRDAQKSASCLRNARAFSGIFSYFQPLNLHAPELVERVDDLVPDATHELQLDICLAKRKHRAVNVVGGSGRESLAGGLALIDSLVGRGCCRLEHLPEQVCPLARDLVGLDGCCLALG